MPATEKDLYLKIGRPHNTCVACGAEIAHAGKHPSVLRRPGQAKETEGELALDPDAPRREDYCADCWQKMSEHDYMGFWVTKREPPKQRKIESKKERNAGLLAWFDHLQGLPQEVEIQQALYFLAHLLMKYGVFKWQRTDAAADGTEQIVFKQTGSDEEIVISAVEMDDERSAEIMKELDAFLIQYANAQPEAEPDVAADDTGDAAPAEA